MSESFEIIKNNIQRHVEDFWSWALESNSKEQILNGEADSPAFPNWNEAEKQTQ